MMSYESMREMVTFLMDEKGLEPEEASRVVFEIAEDVTSDDEGWKLLNDAFSGFDYDFFGDDQEEF